MDAKKKPKALDKAVKEAQAGIKKFEEMLNGKPSSGQGIRRGTSGIASKIMRAAFGISSTGDAPTKDEKAGITKAKAMAERVIQDFNKLLAGPIERSHRLLAQFHPGQVADGQTRGR